MSKTTYILALIMLCSILSYGQQILFYKNSNYQANLLHQSLNKEGDSLLLESKTKQILKIDIFSDDYSDSIIVGSNKTEIDLKSLPLGSFVIQAKLDKKWIVMYLEKKDDLIIEPTLQKKKNKDLNIRSSQQELNLNDEQSLSYIEKPYKVIKDYDSYFYWVVIESNSSFGSSKTMRLEYKEDIEKLISKNKLELKSNVGKANKLIIYEIYNKSEFMKKQFRNPAYYTTAEASKFMNTEPFYVSSDQTEKDY